ncbi:hypothetical protein GCM10022419_021470 [Nonomuraea rosea]|uniref:Uncharacterized protein n=1 Tax=Nonomuraea rosea TaxID=638574 RepID=A0ABP6VTJ2_9ACTN
MAKPEHPEEPDVEIRASAKAREIRFHHRPDVTVEAVAEPTGECVSGSERTGLPDQVAEGVTYRDIQIDFRVIAKLTAPGEEPGASSSAGPGEKPGASSSASPVEEPGARSGAEPSGEPPTQPGDAPSP